MRSNVEIPFKQQTIRNDLFGAYKEYYEEELKVEFDRVSDETLKGLTMSEVELGVGHVSYEKFVERRVREIILEHTPKQRLEVYLEWEGILGYTETVYNISLGNLYVEAWR